MVQTEQQYICVHQCLLVVLEGKEGTEREIHDNQGYEGKSFRFFLCKFVTCGGFLSLIIDLSNHYNTTTSTTIMVAK